MDPLTDRPDDGDLPDALDPPDAPAPIEPIEPVEWVEKVAGDELDGVAAVRTTGLVPLHPAAVNIWRITGALWALVVGAIAIVVCALVGSGVAVVIATAATATLLALTWVMPPRRYRWWRYAIGDDALEIHRGVWVRTSSSVPFHRIQQIDVAQGPLQRRHGVVTLQLRTAAAASDGIVPHLDAEDAAALRTGLLRVAARSAVDDGH